MQDIKPLLKIRSKREEDKNSSLLVTIPDKGTLTIGVKEIEAIDNIVFQYFSRG